MQQVFIQGFHQAFTIAIANSMFLGVGAAILAVVALFAIREIPLRRHVGAEPGTEAIPAPEAEAVRSSRMPALD